MTFLSKAGLIGVTFSAMAMGVMAAGAQADTVKVGLAAEPYPPFAYTDASGKWQGWEVDMMGAICLEAKLECEITPISWDGIIPALQSKKIDMIMASLSITPDRLKVIDFSDKYYNTPAVIVGDKRLEMDATAASMENKILGVQSGTIHRKYIQKHFADTADSVKEYQTQDEANQDLVAGRIDALQADSIAMMDFINSPQGQACCEVKGEVAQDLEILGPGVGAGIRKGDDKLRAAVNEAILALRDSGQYQEISAKYFSFDPYGQ
ncbi:transporter substrate-binding domain-containing protein [Aliamphritea hakodatensis]|uniref:transporter substrate-binding domain-containing protein n=1 Tax=Aliamphritea hakodatensis TaxID=2895352 RepID=UPI0022FD4BC6|nr:transporter substrate-binding domain-containing protein [Aliamphritea hakodatensis]